MTYVRYNGRMNTGALLLLFRPKKEFLIMQVETTKAEREGRKGLPLKFCRSRGISCMEEGKTFMKALLLLHLPHGGIGEKRVGRR